MICKVSNAIDWLQRKCPCRCTSKRPTETDYCVCVSINVHAFLLSYFTSTLSTGSPNMWSVTNAAVTERASERAKEDHTSPHVTMFVAHIMRRTLVHSDHILTSGGGDGGVAQRQGKKSTAIYPKMEAIMISARFGCAFEAVLLNFFRAYVACVSVCAYLE